MECSSPELRFDGYANAWEQRKFSDVFSFLQNNTLSRAELSYTEGSTLNVHYGDVLVKFGELLDLGQAALPRIADDALAARLSCPALADGDVIIADTAEDEAVGKCTELRGCGEKTVVSGLHTMACKPAFDFAPGYLGYYMNSPAFHDQLLPLMQGIKVISVSKGAISDTVVSFPSFGEQKLIGASLCELDNLITLHQRELNKLAAIKQSLLKKMFPKLGSNMPEIRFGGFEDPWAEKPLSHYVTELSTGRSVNSDDSIVRSKDIAILKTSCLLGDRFDATQRKRVTTKEVGLVRCPVEAGTIIVSRMNGSLDNVGLCGFADEDIENLFLPDRLWKIRPHQSVSAYFLYLYMTTPAVKCRYPGICSGSQGSVRSIPQDEFLALSVSCPMDIREQRMIASLFRNLSDLIDARAQELKKLRSIKSAMLQKMLA